MHGGAAGSGAPAGDANGAWRHGRRTQEAMAFRSEIAGWLRMLRETAAAVSD